MQISMFLGIIPMALCTIINGTVLIAGPQFGSWVATLVFALWWIDVVLTVASSFAIPLLMFHIHELALETMTAVWLLPIVPCVVASASGGVVATILMPSWAIGVILVRRGTLDALSRIEASLQALQNASAAMQQAATLHSSCCHHLWFMPH